MPDAFPALRAVVLDATNARVVAEFYRELLGYEYRSGDEAPPRGQPDPHGDDWLVLRDRTGDARLAVQHVAELPASTWPEARVPQQLHLDLTVAGVDAARGPACLIARCPPRTSRTTEGADPTANAQHQPRRSVADGPDAAITRRREGHGRPRRRGTCATSTPADAGSATSSTVRYSASTSPASPCGGCSPGGAARRRDVGAAPPPPAAVAGVDVPPRRDRRGHELDADAGQPADAGQVDVAGEHDRAGGAVASWASSRSRAGA